MKFAEIRDRIVNNPGFRTLAEVRQAGYRVVRERDGDRYFLAKPEELHPLLVRLGDIAEVRFGIKTGANEFFYLQPVGRTVKEVAELVGAQGAAPQPPVRVQNGAGWEGEIEAGWLRPVIKSPREIRTLRVRLDDLQYLVFMPPEDVRELWNRMIQSIRSSKSKDEKEAVLQEIAREYDIPMDDVHDPDAYTLLERYIHVHYPLAAAYIRWGEGQGYQYRPTCKSRQCWWDLGMREPSSFIWPMIHNDRLPLAIHDPRIAIDHNLFEISINDGDVLAALMTTSYEVMVRELLGRSNLGQGALKTEGIDIVRFLVFDPFTLTSTQRQWLLFAFHRLAQREIRSIFEELGFTLCPQGRHQCKHPEHPYEHVDPEALTLDQVRRASPDRFELDAVVFDILGLTADERLAVYRAVAQLVKDRLVKARSV